MELYFLRHAIAVEPGTPEYKDDSKRPLTEEGRKKMCCVAHGMHTLGLSFDTILCSPYVRAKQTAEIVVQVLKLKTKINFTINLIPDASFEKLVQEVRGDFLNAKNILFVGHEPHMTGLISFILNSGRHISIDLKKGGLCHISQLPTFGQENAVLNWLLFPSQLCLMQPVQPKKR